MTILNISIDEKKKKRIKELVKIGEYKTISEFVRSSINEKLTIKEKSEFNFDINDIPNWIPDNKYIGFVNGAITSVADTPAQVSREIASKFPDLPCKIVKKGKKNKVPEYIFSTFTDLKC